MRSAGEQCAFVLRTSATGGTKRGAKSRFPLPEYVKVARPDLHHRAQQSRRHLLPGPEASSSKVLGDGQGELSPREEAGFSRVHNRLWRASRRSFPRV